MTEERQTDATGGTSDETTGDAVVSSGTQSVEEVEAFWRNRQSGLSKSHNAETAALKAQIESLKAAPAPAPSDETPEAARVRELEGELQRERTARQAAQLQAQYPMAAAVLGESIANLPVEKIAAIEAAYDGGALAPRIDPNAARRPTGVPGQASQKPLNEKTKDELLADLRRAAPTIREEARNSF